MRFTLPFNLLLFLVAAAACHVVTLKGNGEKNICGTGSGVGRWQGKRKSNEESKGLTVISFN